MKLPRLLKGWTWEVDRTSDVVYVAVKTSSGYVAASSVLAVRGKRIWFNFVILAAFAYWEKLIAQPVRAAFIRFEDSLNRKRLARDEQRSEYRQSLARSLNGIYDHTGTLIKESN